MATEEVLQIHHAEEPTRKTGISIQEQGAVMVIVHVMKQVLWAWCVML